MTRFCARVTIASLPDAARAASARELAQTFTARPDEQLQTVANPHVVAALGRGHANAELWTDGMSLAIVCGTPTGIRGDAALERLVAEHGLARACALRYGDAGSSFLDALQGGPFALVVHRAADNRTLLAADKLGIQAVFYGARDGELVFANKLDILRRNLDAEIDPQAIYDYLYFHNVPSPATIYKGVHRLPPGGFLEWDARGARTGSYWSLRFESEDGGIDFARTKAEFVDLLKRAVSRELEAPDEVGCFLSGGTDSSTLAGMVGALGARPARTYSIGFEQRGFDEMEYARIAVRHFGTKQREYYLQPSDIARFAPRLADIYGQPFGNSSAVPAYHCAAMARADGVRKMIAGDGGDELFGGNQRYATQQLFSYYTDLPQALRRGVLEPLAFRTPGAKSIAPLRKLGRYIEQALEPMPDRLQTYNYLNRFAGDSIFESDFIGAVDTDAPRRAFAAEYDGAHASRMLNKMMALDLKFTLTDNDLPKVIETCDAAGCEVAFPFLHQEIVEFAARLPARQKVNRLRLRYFFKKALGDFLPIEIIRKKKHGFGMPFGDWLLVDKPLRELAFDSMGMLKRRGIVRPSFIDDLCNVRLNQHPNYYGGFMWILMVLELWWQWESSVSSPAADAELRGRA